MKAELDGDTGRCIRVSGIPGPEAVITIEVNEVGGFTDRTPLRANALREHVIPAILRGLNATPAAASPRWVPMCIPGDNDFDPGSWFAFNPVDRRALPAVDRREAAELCRRLNDAR